MAWVKVRSDSKASCHPQTIFTGTRRPERLSSPRRRFSPRNRAAMVRRLPVIQNSPPASAPSLGKTAAAVTLIVVAGFCWAVLLWAVAGFGSLAIGASCFAACGVAGAVVGSQVARASRPRLFAAAGLGFGLVVVLLALLGGTLGGVFIFVAAFLALTALATAGFFVGGWFLTFRR